MPQVGYVRLVNSNGSLDKRIRVYANGFSPTPIRSSQGGRTVTGDMDLSIGNTKWRWSIKAKVRETETDANYASLANLRTFHGYSSPQGTPTNVLTFYDSESVSYSVVMSGPLVEISVGPQITGPNAWYSVELSLEEL